MCLEEETAQGAANKNLPRASLLSQHESLAPQGTHTHTQTHTHTEDCVLHISYVWSVLELYNMGFLMMMSFSN